MLPEGIYIYIYAWHLGLPAGECCWDGVLQQAPWQVAGFSLLCLPFLLGAPLDIYLNITPKNGSGIWFSYLKLILLSTWGFHEIFRQVLDRLSKNPRLTPLSTGNCGVSYRVSLPSNWFHWYSSPGLKQNMDHFTTSRLATNNPWLGQLFGYLILRDHLCLASCLCQCKDCNLI